MILNAQVTPAAVYLVHPTLPVSGCVLLLVASLAQKLALLQFPVHISDSPVGPAWVEGFFLGILVVDFQIGNTSASSTDTPHVRNHLVEQAPAASLHVG